MTPQSAKAKGRKNQQRFRDLLLMLDSGGMYESTSMGANGSDIVVPARRLPFEYVELRKHEKFPSLNAVVAEMAAKSGPSWLYGLSRNRQDPVYILSEEALERLLATWYHAKGFDWQW